MQNKTFRRRPTASPLIRVPDFESGLIAEHLLSFGGQHQHVDPKTGLSLYGPYSLVGQTSPTLRSAIVGIVGPASMIADAEAWLQACKGMLTNDGSQPFLYPHFPGFHKDAPFHCELIFGDTWREPIKDSAYKAALAVPDFYDRVKTVVHLYAEALETIASREPQPQVVLCCIPQDIVDSCTVQKGRRARRKPSPPLPLRGSRANDRGQLSLFDAMDGTPGAEDEEWGHQNLRRGLKAEAMQFGLPTQLVWPRTLRLAATPSSGPQRVQDLATRAWNFSTALYHKAGGAPWRLAELEPGVCFVGISFYKEMLEENPRIRSSMAQAFTAAGDGYVLRGRRSNGMKGNRADLRISTRSRPQASCATSLTSIKNRIGGACRAASLCIRHRSFGRKNYRVWKRHAEASLERTSWRWVRADFSSIAPETIPPCAERT